MVGAVSMKQYAASLAASVARPSAMRANGTSRRWGVSALRRSCHRLKVAWRSVSINQAVSPARSASTAKCAASMVLPLPPFCDAMTIVFMKESLSIKEQLHESIISSPALQVPDEWRTTNANCSLQTLTAVTSRAPQWPGCRGFVLLCHVL